MKNIDPEKVERKFSVTKICYDFETDLKQADEVPTVVDRNQLFKT